MLARFEQQNQHNLAQHVNAGNAAYLARIRDLTQAALGKAASEADAHRQALAQFYHLMQHQAAVLSYAQVLSLLAVLVFIVAPLPLILKRPPKGGVVMAH
jgi:DHA2 family multidrug resistance protein